MTPFKPKLGIWDPRPRLLGMFHVYTLTSAELTMSPHIPVVGVYDHLVHCDCGHKSGVPHPKFLAAAAYVRLGNTLVSVSWPTWFKL